ncbi:hypothetical protein C0993_001448 [Termitomyces sp. T159_Od127]|nr:hypothetical protein C0993_001448 [Termitomyces sp. T159_Od127]
MLQEQSSLLSLSTELVLLILGLSSNPTLIAIAKTCRRLHYLALPIYLARYGIASSPAPRSFALRDKALRALPGLSAAVFITSADDLWCKFQGPEEFYFQRGVRDLHAFVHGLSSVSRVSLDVGNIDTRWIDGLATAVSDAWKPTFIRMLDAALERGCTSLTVAHGHFLVASSFERPQVVPERTFLGLSFPPRRKRLSSARVLPGNTLASFNIHSNMLLAQPFYDWTLRTLHANPITSLSLRVPGLAQDTWPLVLGAITLPSLASFSAESLDIAFPTLLLFLRRHPTISALTLHPHFPYPRAGAGALPKRRKNHRSNTLLPRLAALGGSTANVAALLGHLRADTALRVREVTLVLPMHQRVFRAADYDALTALVVGVVRGTSARPRALALRFSVPCETLRCARRAPEDGACEVRALLGSVESVRFGTDGRYMFARWVMPRLPAWLGAHFVRLRNVVLSEECVEGVDVCRREMVVRAIKEACPGVKNVLFAHES